MGKGKRDEQETEIPTKEAITEFWAGIWSQEVEHKEEAYWIRKVKENKNKIQAMPDSQVTMEEFTAVLKKLNNWKAPGLDRVQNFWYKRLHAVHSLMLRNINKYIEEPEQIPPFFMEGITYMLPKKGDTTDPAKYRPIACLPTSYKIFTACLTRKIQEHCMKNDLIAEEQKGSRRNTYGCKEQLVIDQLIMGQAKKENRRLCTAYIDYAKAYDSVPHTWLIKSLQIIY